MYDPVGSGDRVTAYTKRGFFGQSFRENLPNCCLSKCNGLSKTSPGTNMIWTLGNFPVCIGNQRVGKGRTSQISILGTLAASSLPISLPLQFSQATSIMLLFTTSTALPSSFLPRKKCGPAYSTLSPNNFRNSDFGPVVLHSHSKREKAAVEECR